MSDPAPSPHGGTRPKPPEELRNPVLRTHGAAVAAASMQRIYQTWPDLEQRYGERGRRLTAEDNHWHLNVLDVAMTLDDPEYFVRYAEWLVRFLGPRGLGPDHVAGAFGFLAEGLTRAEVPQEQHSHRQALVSVLHEAMGRVLEGPRTSATDITRGDPAIQRDER